MSAKSNELSDGWIECLIEDVVGKSGIFKDGDWVESKDQDPSGDVRLIQLADIGDGRFVDKSSRFLTKSKARKLNCTFLRAGDILVARMPDPLGRCCIFPLAGDEQYVTVVDICAIRFGDSTVNAKFMMYLINSPSIRGKISALQSGSTRKRISRGNLTTIPLPLPPLNEQNRIVAKIETLFSELDKGIESLKTAREQLKVYRQAVLKNAFEGKLTAQWREQNKDKLETAQQLLTHANQNIGFRLKAPSSWIVCRVEDVLVLGPSNGRSVKDRKGGFPVLRLTALKGGKIDLSESKFGDWGRDDAQAYIVKEGDFLMSRGNGSKHLVGRGGIVPKHEDEVAYPDTIVRLRVDPELILIKFFSLLWESRVLRDQIEGASQTTAGIYKINQGHIKAFAVPVPTLTEQQLIVRELEEKMSLIDHQLHDVDLAIAASETLRQSILKKAFSGQLVPQDPSDEPASALLARIQAEKAVQPKLSKSRKRTTSA